MTSDANKYLLFFDVKFTLIEKYIYKLIKEQGGCSDKEIAEILTLHPQEVAYVIQGALLDQCIQGDASRRTIADDFTELEYAVRSKHEGEHELGKKKLLTLDNKLCVEKSNDYTEKQYTQVPKELQAAKAKKYFLIAKAKSSSSPLAHENNELA